MNVYRNKGYVNRADYLSELSNSYDPDAVYILAEMLGPEEDFDGLTTALEEYDYEGLH